MPKSREDKVKDARALAAKVAAKYALADDNDADEAMLARAVVKLAEAIMGI